MEIRKLVEAVRADRESGAAEVARMCADAIVRALARERAADAVAVRAELAELARALVQAQPAMAPVRGVAAAALTGALGTDAAEARQGAAEAVAAYLRRLETAPVEAGRRAAALLRPGARVLTLSRSSTVQAALLEAGRAGALAVVCLESRPTFEGRRLAAELAAAGVQATLAPDAAVAALLQGCALLLVGADSIGDQGVLNKIGTHAAALAAREAGVPAYAVADSTKLLAPGAPQPVADERPPDEVWSEAPGSVHVWNRYFENTPLRLFTGVILEDAIISAAEVRARRAGLREPAELR
jgi:translation initiation factor 2B subunit (eIF-2B alpha/beta/delta family)